MILGVGCGLLGAASLAAPAAATFRGHNGRVAMAWLDNDQGAHFEAAYAVVAVPWLRGAGRARNLVSCTSLDGCPQFSHPGYSPDGSQVVYTELPFSASAPQPKSELLLADADGTNPVTITDPAENYFDPSFTPSGRRLLFVRSATASPGDETPPSGEIATSDLAGGHIRTVTAVRGASPKLSPNGRTVLFEHGGSIWSVGIGGGNAHRLIRNSTMPDWSPSGRSIVYVAGNYPKGNHTLMVARADGTHARPVAGAYPHHPRGELGNLNDPVFSPDGRWIAFSTTYYDENGDPYLMRVPAGGGAVKMLWTSGVLDAGGTDLGTSWQPLR